MLFAALAAMFGASDARAAGSPNINLSKTTPGQILYGANADVTLTASNPVAEPYGYNLSFRDVLPDGVSYVPSSANAGDPTIIADQPSAGETTLIWQNVADLSPNSSFALTYQVSHSTVTMLVGDTYTNNAGAYINDDPRYVPDFDATGLPISGATSYTGSDTASALTELVPFELEISEPNTEGEILRGLHDHQTVYTFELRNNHINATNGFTIDAWLPAGLEFLGCGLVDNTSDAPTNPGFAEEYAGAGVINPGNAPLPTANPCPTISTVETVQVDPDGAGPLPNAVYTHVVFTGLGNLATSATARWDVIAAIPIRENTLDWNGAGAGLGTPPATTGAQTANLDNNSGAETTDEQNLTVYGIGSGSYQGPIAGSGSNPLTDDHSLQRSAEDLSVHKSTSDVSLDQGEITTWTLLIETSEYRYVENVRVTDTVPDGYCPLGTSNLEVTPPAALAECDPLIGVGPSVNGGPANSAPYRVGAGFTEEHADGTWTVFWDSTVVPELFRIQPSSSVTISFPTRTRAFYQESFDNAGPVLANDSASNTVSIAGLDYVTCESGDGDCSGAGIKIDADEPDGVDDLDSSSAGQDAAGPTIDKQVSQPVAVPTILDCSTATYIDTVASSYTPGDRVCWKLRIDFPGLLDTEHQTVNDFLPNGSTYEAGSWTATTNNTVTISSFTENGLALSWDVVTADTGGQVFEVVFSSIISDPSAAQDGDILGNLMKYASENTAGTSFPLRDQVDFAWVEPQLTLVKGVNDVNGVPGGGNPADTDGSVVRASDVVTYRVDITNDGTRDAVNTVVWDNLPTQITDCSSVPVISDSGSCVDLGATVRVVWNSVTVSASSTKTLTYDLTVHSTIGADERLDNTAGVVSYEAVTNTGTNFSYEPASNIDPTATPNTDPADDTSFAEAPDANTAKGRTTEVTQAGNATSNQATIGEEITYTVTLTIPEGTTVYGATLSDPLGTRHTYVSGSALVTLPDLSTIVGDSGSSGGFTFDTAGNTISLTFPATYANAPASGDDTVTIVFDTKVDDDATNDRGDWIPNVATLAWNDSTSTNQTNTGSRSTRIVEPNVALSKSNDATGPVSPSDVIGFTVTAQNVAGSNVSTANDLVVTDVVPTGLTVNVGSISGGGTYDGPSRTITWNIASQDPGTSTPLTYTATIDTGVAGQSSLTNVANLTATSLPPPEDADGERTATTAASHAPPVSGYADAAQSVLTVVAATIGKAVNPTTRTIGEQSSYTITVTIPADVDLFDTTIVDTVPDGLTFTGYGATTTADCASPSYTGTTTNLNQVVNGDGTTTIAWYLGDVPGCSVQRVVTLVYTATADLTYTTGGGDVVDTDVLQNAANLSWNFTDVETDATVRSSGTIPSGPFSTTTADATADVTIVEPSLLIDKDVSGQVGDTDAREAQPGDSFTYTIVVTNNGTSPAYDITVDDLPDVELENVVPATGAGFVTDGWTAVDPDIVWTIPGPIAAGGGTQTLTYTADLVASAGLTDGQTAINTASIPQYHGVDVDAPPPGTYRVYAGPSDTVTVTVDVPALAVDKTTGGAGFPESADAELLQPFTWRVVVSNTAETATAVDFDVSDVLPPNWTYLASSASFAPGGAIEPAITPGAGGDTLTWTDVGDIAAGDSVTLTFQATPQLASATTPGSGAGNPHVNSASATTSDSSGATASASGPYAAGPDTAQAVLQVPILGIAKTPDGGAAVAGQPSQFTITVSNTGTAPGRNVIVTDVLPAGLSYTAGTAAAVPAAGFSEVSVTPDSPSPGETTIVWSVTQVAAAGNVAITLPVTLDSPLVDGTTLTNSSSFVSDEDPTGGSDTGSLVVTSAPVWLTASTKTATPPAATTVAPGSTITYAIHAENTGNENATNVVVTDAIPPDSTYVAASATSTPAATTEFLVGGVYQGTEPADPADVRGIRWTVGTLNITESTDLGFQVTVDLPLPNGTLITNVGQLTSDQTPTPTSLGPISHTVTSGTALTLTKSVDDTDLDVNAEGTALGYTLVLTNTGDETANNVEITDGPPAGTVVTGITAGGATAECSTDPGPAYTYGTCPGSLDTVTQIRWSTPTVVAPTGSITAGFDVDVVVPAATGVADGTTIDNTASVDSDETTPAPSNNVTTTLTTAPILSLTKTVSPNGLVAPGATLVYSLDYASTGSLPVQTVLVTDAIPANTTYVAASASAGAEFLVGGTYVATEPADPAAVEGLRWDLGDLAIGDSGTLVFSATAAAVLDDALKLKNAATATSSNHADVVSSVETEIDSGATITITKDTGTVEAELGQQVTYAITASVSGNANADPLIVTDALPAELAFLSATDGGTFAGGVVTWNLGTAAPGTSWQVFVTATIVGGSTHGTSVVNVAQATGGNNASAGAAVSDDATLVALSGEPCARGGSVEVSTSRVLVGVESSVTVRVANPDGTPAANIDVVLNGKGVRGAVRATTNANGEAVLTFVASRPNGELTVEVADCESTDVLAAVKSKICSGIEVTPETLAVGARNRVRLEITSGGEPVQKQRVTFRGAGIKKKAKTAKNGVIKIRLKPNRGGVVRIRVPRALTCTYRVGAADGLLGSHLTG